MNERAETSPYGVYLDHLKRGELAYQVGPDGKAVFFPRMVQPGTGADLTWRVSAGLGTVYTVTVIAPRDGTPYTVAMIDMDEGYRLMSTVLAEDAYAVKIGQRVKGSIEEREGADPRPVFHLLQGAGA